MMTATAAPIVELYRRMAAQDLQLEQLLRALDPSLPRGILDEDRHARAMAQAQAAGITGLRNALLENA